MGNTMIVRVGRLRVRKGPKLDEANILSLRRLRIGEQVEVLAASEAGFVKVRSKGYFTPIEGFVAESCLAEPSSYPLLSPEKLADDFAAFAPKLAEGKRKELVAAMLVGLPAAAIVSPRRIAHFLAQCAHESGGFKATEEKLRYSAQRIIDIFAGETFKDGPRKGELRWPKKDDPEALAKVSLYARHPEKFANYAYAWKIGNGDVESGDGYWFRGRGFMQLTGRDNYAAIGRRIGCDLVAEPDLLVKQVDVAMLSACAYWAMRDEEEEKAGRPGLNALAENDDLRGVTRLINTALDGLEHRRQKLNDARAIWADAPSAEPALVS